MSRCHVCHGPKRPLPPIPDWLTDARLLAPKACSIVCLTRLSMKEDWMEPTEKQKQEALEAASDAAGDFLEATKAFDLRRLSRDRWLRMLRIVVETYAGKLRELELNDDIPF